MPGNSLFVDSYTERQKNQEAAVSCCVGYASTMNEGFLEVRGITHPTTNPAQTSQNNDRPPQIVKQDYSGLASLWLWVSWCARHVVAATNERGPGTTNCHPAFRLHQHLFAVNVEKQRASETDHRL